MITCNAPLSPLEDKENCPNFATTPKVDSQKVSRLGRLSGGPLRLVDSNRRLYETSPPKKVTPREMLPQTPEKPIDNLGAEYSCIPSPHHDLDALCTSDILDMAAMKMEGLKAALAKVQKDDFYS